MVGERKDELGGSVFYKTMGELGKNVPKPNLTEAKHQIYGHRLCGSKVNILHMTYLMGNSSRNQ